MQSWCNLGFARAYDGWRMDFDPEEIGNFPGRGMLSLRSAIKEITARPPEGRKLVSLYRDRGKEPSILTIGAIEELAKLDQHLKVLEDRLGGVEKGEVWGGDHPGPYTSEEKADAIAGIEAQIARVKSGDT